MKHLILFILISPYLIWIFYAPQLSLKSDLHFSYPLMMGFVQAFLSSTLALLFGLVGSLALFSAGGLKRKNFAEAALLAPNFLPPLFIVMSALSFSKALTITHQGLAWVVLVHSLMNAGIFAVAFHRLVIERCAPALEVAQVYGVGRYQLMRSILLPMVAKPLAYTFIFVFGLCLVSFSIPFMLGGPGITSLEIHIYRLVRTQGDWGGALIFSIIQSIAVFFVSGLLMFTQTSDFPSRTRGIKISSYFYGLAFLPIFILSLFWFVEIFQLVWEGPFISLLARMFEDSSFWLATVNSLFMAALVFIFLLLGSLLVVAQSPPKFLARFFQGYLAPSVAVLGFSVSLLPGELEFHHLFKSSFAFVLLVFPILFRWMILESWLRLKPQIATAQVFGASRWEITKRILWPQLQESSLRLALLGSIWVLGDFGVSSFFFNGDRTLALKVTQALNTYDLNMAYLLGLFIFALGGISYFMGRKVIDYVAG